MKKLKYRAVEISLTEIDRPKVLDRLEISEEEIDELARSIQERGLLQPITVSGRDGRYEIVYGDRRVLAVKKLGWKKIPAVVRETGEKDIAIDRAVENLQRVELTTVEEALIYQRMMDKGGIDDAKIGKLVGKSSGVVKRRRHILRMPENFQKALHKGEVSVGVCESLMGVGDGTHRNYLLEMAVAHGVTSKVARGWVDDWKRSMRKIEDDSGGGRIDIGINETRPIYVTCDLCQGPEELGKIQRLSICKGCKGLIIKAIMEGE